EARDTLRISRELRCAGGLEEASGGDQISGCAGHATERLVHERHAWICFAEAMDEGRAKLVIHGNGRVKRAGREELSCAQAEVGEGELVGHGKSERRASVRSSSRWPGPYRGTL